MHVVRNIRSGAPGRLNISYLLIGRKSVLPLYDVSFACNGISPRPLTLYFIDETGVSRPIKISDAVDLGIFGAFSAFSVLRGAVLPLQPHQVWDIPPHQSLK